MKVFINRKNIYRFELTSKNKHFSLFNIFDNVDDYWD